jgi:serine protease SohB
MRRRCRWRERGNPNSFVTMAKPNPTWFDQTLDFMRPVLPARLRGDVPIVPVVRLSGVIGVVTPLRPGLTLAGLARTLDRAFKLRHARAVALLINSPGGSPVQSHLIYRRVRQLAEEHELPVIAFVEDVGASGGFMLACAADEIVCDASSLVGSIGVVGGSFGFHQLLEKLGIERRLYTSGEHKAMLDPFLPEKPEDVKRLKTIQKELHENFIALVKARRGSKLQGPEKTLFSGEFWTGARALELGLIDSLGELRATLRARFGEKVLTPLVNAERSSLLRRLFGAEAREGDPWRHPGFADEIVSALEARALWSRYGL